MIKGIPIAYNAESCVDIRSNNVLLYSVSHGWMNAEHVKGSDMETCCQTCPGSAQ